MIPTEFFLTYPNTEQESSSVRSSIVRTDLLFLYGRVKLPDEITSRFSNLRVFIQRIDGVENLTVSNQESRMDCVADTVSWNLKGTEISIPINRNGEIFIHPDSDESLTIGLRTGNKVKK